MCDFTNTFRAFFQSSFRVSGLIAAFAFLICLFAAQSAQAQLTLTVTRTDDRNATCDSGVDCSLREAVNAANAAVTSDTINFAIPAGSAGCTSGVCTITLTLGEFVVNDGPTAGALTITNSTGASNLLISGNNTSRVFFLVSGANLTISGATITKGNGTGTTSSGFNVGGGGILNNGTLTLTNSIVSGNMTSNSGGGIYNDGGTTTLTNSTVSGNTATNGRGGGIYNLNGTTTLTNSTVSGNTSGNGGGILNQSGTLTLTGSTVSGNTSGNSGGGILNLDGTSTLTNSTVSGNTATSGGGGIVNDSFDAIAILNLTSVTVTGNSSTETTCTFCAGGISNFGGIANLKNTIVALNTAANASAPPDFGGDIAAGSSFNLIGNGTGTTGISNGDADSNQVGTAASPIDPKLAPLANNGGATQTHALLFGSPAIDKGNSFGLTTDQRGFTRPVNNFTIPNATGGDGADIGAFEVQLAPTVATVSVGGRVMTASGRGIRNVVIRLTDSEGNLRTAISNSFGYYRFNDVAAGATYILTATGKRFSFSQPSQVLNINDETDGVNFIGSPVNR